MEKKPVIVDVRQVPPFQRHPMIFDAFEALEDGETMILVNDHDPRPLHYQFLAERAGTFEWTYLEKGPLDWRVEIKKVGG